MPVESRLQGSVSARFVASASEVGFHPPPVSLILKLSEGPHYWTLFMQTVPPGPIHGISEWIEPFAPLRLEFGSHHVIRADFDPLPEAWAATFQGVKLDALRLEPDGQALVSVTGSRTLVSAFTRRVRSPMLPLDVRRIGATPSHPHLLTDPQDQALRAAVDSGYYLIPRPLNLRQLAKRLQISSASLSERLRRAEGRVITRYVREGGKSPWDESTLFDERPFEADTPAWPDPIQAREGSS